MSDAIEVQLKSIVTRSTVSRGTETHMLLLIQPNDVHKIDPLRDMLNERFGMALAGPIANDESQPAQEDRQRHMAASLGRYTQRAVILCKDIEFQQFLASDFNENWSGTLTQLVDFYYLLPDDMDRDAELRIALAKAAILHLMGGIESRKEIIEGTPIGDLWERLMDRFAKWKIERNSARPQS